MPSPDGPRRPVGNGMLYLAYQLQTDIMEPIRSWAGKAINAGGVPLLSNHPAMRNLTAVYELIPLKRRCLFL